MIKFSLLILAVFASLTTVFALRPYSSSSLLSIASPSLVAPFSRKYYVSPQGQDQNSGENSDAPLKTIQKAIDLAKPGETIILTPGDYYQDIVTRRSGQPSTPIKIIGTPTAILRGSGSRGRVLEINHSYITLENFTIDGLGGPPEQKKSYREKLIYILGKENRSGPTGVKITGMTLQNAAGECIRLRYFTSKNEIAYNNINNCGIWDFRFNDGGKNGEGIYIGTAPEQLDDGKNPTIDLDRSNNNWIHHNQINTQGNECVDIKESSRFNIVEYNFCTGQKDMESGGFDSRGGANVFRYNEAVKNLGAGVRLGGDTVGENINNEVYGNIIRDNLKGGIKFQQIPQGKICGNSMSGNTGGNTTGRYGDQFDPVKPCT